MNNNQTVKIKNNPKLRNNNIFANSNWYCFYAGFSDVFVKELFEIYCPKTKDVTVLDPWNGSGTTTLVASILGYANYGFDINPVMVVVAKAKLYSASSNDLRKLASAFHGNQENTDTAVFINDPLRKWFSLRTTKAIRDLEHKIHSIFEFDFPKSKQHIIANLDLLTNQLSFYYIVFFVLLRKLTANFVCSNPTWIKSKIEEDEKIDICYTNLFEQYREIFECIVNASEKLPEVNSTIKIGNSKNICINSNSVDFIITSPPYCTRIDYAVYTKVELSLLGYSEDDIGLLRNNMIGTPTITGNTATVINNIDSLMGKTLNLIANHNSKAAKSYYYKTYYQYFQGMEYSLKEICRVLKKDGMVIMVVQDSWFKNVHIDLPNIFIEMFIDDKLELINVENNLVSNNMSYINTKSSNYQKEKINNESVLIFKKRSE